MGPLIGALDAREAVVRAPAGMVVLRETVSFDVASESVMVPVVVRKDYSKIL